MNNEKALKRVNKLQKILDNPAQSKRPDVISLIIDSRIPGNDKIDLFCKLKRYFGAL